MTSPVLPHHPLDHPGVVKILLSESASAALAAVGLHHRVIATKADATALAHAQGRMVLLCLPLTKELADAAASVALGRAVPKKLRTHTTS